MSGHVLLVFSLQSSLYAGSDKVGRDEWSNNDQINSWLAI